jgi:hypothetical protein
MTAIEQQIPGAWFKSTRGLLLHDFKIIFKFIKNRGANMRHSH